METPASEFLSAMPELPPPPVQMVLMAIVLQARINARLREIRVSRPPSTIWLNGNEEDEINGPRQGAH